MKRKKTVILILMCFAIGVLFVASCGGGGGGGGSSSPGPIMLASIDTAGTEGNNISIFPGVNSDGRYVSFYSSANNLVANDTNNSSDIFVRDTVSSITSRVSVSTAGSEANNSSFSPAISSDGRYVAFDSPATNLVPNDTNGTNDIFVHDTVLSITSRVSVSTAGTAGNNLSFAPAISSDGQYVAFESWSSNLVPNITNGSYDIFVRDTVSNLTSRVSVSTAGTEGNGNCAGASISSDGRYVAFESDATNLVPNDINSFSDVFVRDTVSSITSRVSVSTAGTEANSQSNRASISSDGRYIAFDSEATNLVAGDANGFTDIFIRDTVSNITSRVSVSTAGTEGNDSSSAPAISSDGRYVVFESSASNLVPNDTNSSADAFVHDTVTGITSRASVNAAGTEGNNSSTNPFISADGRYVVFESDSTNLIAGTTLSGTTHMFRAPRP